jgi:glutamine amidotransferase
MCLAIYKPAGTEVSLKHLENGFENHSDGAGMAWAVDGVLHVRKGMFALSDVLEQYEQIKDYPALIHFRKATHGKVDAANCHPFLFNDNKLALIHNGVLPIKCNIEGLSDTAHFVKLVLEPMVKIHRVPINDGALNYLICTSIGTDKLAVMDGTGKTYIFNEDKGNWDGGVWYSNTSFRYAYTSYKATPTNTNENWKSHPYFANKGSDTGYKHTNWRKHWTDDDEGDEAYIEFWKRSGAANTSQGCGDQCGSPHAKTQKLPLLLGPTRDGVDEAGNVITVEEVQEEESPVTIINGKEVPIAEGHMLEYGWFEKEIEDDLQTYQLNLGLSREEALIRVFNER